MLIGHVTVAEDKIIIRQPITKGCVTGMKNERITQEQQKIKNPDDW